MDAALRSNDATVSWEPRSKPQAALIACPVFEIFFGGSRGSLKTDSVLGDWIDHSFRYGEHAIGLMVRRTREELVETFNRAKQMFTPLGFKFSGYVCHGPNGSRLTFAYLDNDADAERYQGWNLTRVYVEEIGNFPSNAPILKLMATLRSPAGVPCGFRATGNPGGPGHHWVKERYITPAPTGWKVQTYDYVNPFTKEVVTKERLFIPGKITDHDLLGADYVANLQMSGSEELVRAWLEGDWSVTLGAYFPEFGMARHVIAPIKLPGHWSRFRAMDWGSYRPFSVGWYAVSDGEMAQFPRGALIRYREWYGMKEGQPNTGLKMTAEDVADGILKRTPKGEKISYSVLDPAAFSQDGGPSIAERMMNRGFTSQPADNKRVAQFGRMGGWDQVRSRLVGEDGRPMLYLFDTCTELIRTLPALQHDDLKPEDVDTESEDHAPDELRYACMSRPYVKDASDKPKPKWPYAATNGGHEVVGNLPISELIKRQERRLNEDE